MGGAPPRTIGVLALQGDFEEHLSAFERLGQAAHEVRLPEDLASIDALVIPGGESTTIGRLLKRWGLHEPIRNRVRSGMAVWGTCAGAILLAERCEDQEIDGLRLMDIDIRRNAYGRQVDSFEADIDVPALGSEPFHAVFIRAPSIVGAGTTAEVLARLDGGSVVGVRQASMLATTFHPELTADLRWHEFFIGLARSPARVGRPPVQWTKEGFVPPAHGRSTPRPTD